MTRNSLVVDGNSDLIPGETHIGNKLSAFDVSSVNLFNRHGAVQPKLKINQPGDKFEQEADMVANQVMQTTGRSNTLGTFEKRDEIQRNKAQDMTPRIPGSFHSRLIERQAHGKLMNNDTNREMSSRLGHDFDHVRVHDDIQSARLSESINARAFTYGNNIYFNKNEYAPQSVRGKHLLAHELTHTLQQQTEIRRKVPDHVIPIDYSLISDPIERKLRMETDYEIITWEIALKRLNKGELTDGDLKNDRLLNRMTGLKSAEVDSLIKKIGEFQKRKDKERSEASVEERKKMKEVKTAKIIEWLKVRKVISTPLQSNSSVSYDALGEVNDYKINLKDVEITVKPDSSNNKGNKTTPSTNLEGSFKWVVRGGKITDLTKDNIAFNPTSLKVEITTTYNDDPDKPSAYGKGTTAEDKAEKTTTLRVHEGQHGTDFIDYLASNPLPASLSGGVNGKLTPKQFSDIVKYAGKISEESCELTDQSGFSQDDFLKTDEGKKSGMKSCRKP